MKFIKEGGDRRALFITQTFAPLLGTSRLVPRFPKYPYIFPEASIVIIAQAFQVTTLYLLVTVPETPIDIMAVGALAYLVLGLVGSIFTEKAIDRIHLE